jgi:hypothetical protein
MRGSASFKHHFKMLWPFDTNVHVFAWGISTLIKMFGPFHTNVHVFAWGVSTLIYVFGPFNMNVFAGSV